MYLQTPCFQILPALITKIWFCLVLRTFPLPTSCPMCKMSFSLPPSCPVRKMKKKIPLTMSCPVCKIKHVFYNIAYFLCSGLKVFVTVHIFVIAFLPFQPMLHLLDKLAIIKLFWINFEVCSTMLCISSRIFFCLC